MNSTSPLKKLIVVLIKKTITARMTTVPQSIVIFCSLDRLARMMNPKFKKNTIAIMYSNENFPFSLMMSSLSSGMVIFAKLSRATRVML